MILNHIMIQAGLVINIWYFKDQISYFFNGRSRSRLTELPNFANALNEIRFLKEFFSINI